MVQATKCYEEVRVFYTRKTMQKFGLCLSLPPSPKYDVSEANSGLRIQTIHDFQISLIWKRKLIEKMFHIIKFYVPPVVFKADLKRHFQQILCLYTEVRIDVFQSLRAPDVSVLFKQTVVLKYGSSYEHCTLYTAQRDLRWRSRFALPGFVLSMVRGWALFMSLLFSAPFPPNCFLWIAVHKFCLWTTWLTYLLQMYVLVFFPYSTFYHRFFASVFLRLHFFVIIVFCICVLLLPLMCG